jgi:hypothetical protein
MAFQMVDSLPAPEARLGEVFLLTVDVSCNRCVMKILGLHGIRDLYA